jgi:hypothetical protein
MRSRSKAAFSNSKFLAANLGNRGGNYCQSAMSLQIEDFTWIQHVVRVKSLLCFPHDIKKRIVRLTPEVNFLSRPMPCSPDMAPPKEIPAPFISSHTGTKMAFCCLKAASLIRRIILSWFLPPQGFSLVLWAGYIF